MTRLMLVGCSALLLACGGDPEAPDGGGLDAGRLDAATVDGGPRPDTGPAADTGPDTDAGSIDGGAASGPWLHTSGNAILHADGTPFRGRGANIHDTRSCNACPWSPPNVGEVERRIDELVDVWGANFMRLTLESYASADGRVHWRGLREDADYLADIRRIVEHIEDKDGVYVLVSLWIDPSFSDLGWPTAETREVWRALAAALMEFPHVLFGLVNEPESNFDGSRDAEAWQAMNDTVQAIREVEAGAGSPQHIITVQGTRAWARRLDYYVGRPIEAYGGANIAYETHVYNPATDFDALFIAPSATLPVIIGEFGPNMMTLDEADVLVDEAEARNIPYLAWTFHMRCPPNLLVENSGGGCGVEMVLQPTEWGSRLMARLGRPWGT